MTSSLNVLLVDDDPDDFEMFADALQTIDELDIELMYARDGLAAVEGFKSNAYPKCDVVFLDLNMPRMNGKETLRALKEMQSAKDIPVFIYSTSSSAGDKMDMKILGAAGYVVKHSVFRELCQDLEAILEAIVSRK